MVNLHVPGYPRYFRDALLRILFAWLLLTLHVSQGSAFPHSIPASLSPTFYRLSTLRDPLFSATRWSADFDGDRQPDTARSERQASGDYILKISLSRHPNSRLSLGPVNSGEFIVHDLDTDGDFDVTVLDPIFTRIPVRVWLNSGKGEFKSLPVDTFSEESVLGSQDLPSRQSLLALCSTTETLWISPTQAKAKQRRFLFLCARGALPHIPAHQVSCPIPSLTRRGPP